jgi:hypothetical protein
MQINATVKIMDFFSASRNGWKHGECERRERNLGEERRGDERAHL